MEYLSVRNWDKFQHYKQRKPPWIKLYSSLLCSHNVSALSDVGKFHLVAIMSLASQYDNKVPFDKAWIARVINAKSRINWDALLNCGMIYCKQDASTMLATCKQNACLETETETETEKDNSHASKMLAKPKPSRRCPDDFQITDDLKVWAQANCPGIDIIAETENLRDYEFKAAKTDWKATWRTWMRNATKFAASKAPAESPSRTIAPNDPFWRV